MKRFLVAIAAVGAAGLAYANYQNINVKFPNSQIIQDFVIPILPQDDSVGALKDTIANTIRRNHNVTILPEYLQLVRGNGMALYQDTTHFKYLPAGQAFPANGGTINVTILRANHTSANFLLRRPFTVADTVYDGNAKNIIVDTATTMTPISVCPNCVISNKKYNGSTTPPTNVGTYAVTIDVAATTFYNAASNLYVGTFTITPYKLNNPASNCTVSVTSSHKYNGEAHTPVIVVTRPSTPNPLTLTYGTDYTYALNPITANYIDAGKKAIRVTGKGNYSGDKNLAVTAAAAFFIDSIAPIATDFDYDLSPKPYNGTAQGVSVTKKSTISGMGAITATMYNGSNTAPTAAGTYEVAVRVARATAAPFNYKKADSVFLGYYTITAKPKRDYAQGDFAIANNLFTFNNAKQTPKIDTLSAITCANCHTIAPDSIFYNGKPATSAYPKNAGTYAVTINMAASDSFNAVRKLFVDTFRITPYSIAAATNCTATITAAYQPVYNGYPQMPAANQCTLKCMNSAVTLLATTDYSITIPTASTNAGNVTLTFAGKGNYVGSKTATFKIDSITPTAAHFDYAFTPVTYDEQPHSVSATARSPYSSGMGIAEVLYNGSSTAPTDAGTYQIALRVARNAGTTKNFKKADSVFLGYFTIMPHDMTADGVAVSISGTYEYNGQPHTPTSADVSVTINGVPTPLTYLDDYIYAVSNNVNAGHAALQIIGKGNYAGIKDTFFVIDTAEARVRWGDSIFLYSGGKQWRTGVARGISGESLPLAYSDSGINVGRYRTTAFMQPRNYNYRLTNVDTFFTIAPDTTDVIWNDLIKTFDGSGLVPSATTTDGDALSVVVAVTVSSNTTNYPNVVNVCNPNPPINQQCPYRVVAGISPADPNHVLRKNDTTFVVKQQDVALNWTDTTPPYNGSSQKPIATTTISGVPTTMPVNVIDDHNVDAQNRQVGWYSAYVDRGALDWNKQYEPDTIKWRIKPAGRRVAWSDTVRIYNGAKQVPTAAALALDAVTPVPLIFVDSQINAGRGYRAEVKSTDANYYLTDSVCTYRIDSLAIRVNWSNITLTYNANAQKPTASPVSGVTVGSDVVNIAVSGEQTDAGTNYAARASSANANYKISNKDTLFTILPAPISVVWDSTVRIYNEQPQNPSAIAKDLNGSAIDLVMSSEQTDAGTYKAYVSIYDPLSQNYQNYKITNDTIIFTIAPAALRVTWDTLHFTYTARDTAPTPSVIGSIGGIEVTHKQSNAGTYAVVARPLTANSNYMLENADTIFTIHPVAKNIEWDTLLFIYNQTEQKPAARIIGEGTDTVPLRVTASPAPSVGVSEYRAVAELLNPNYTLQGIKNDTAFSIVSAVISVVWSDTVLTYCGRDTGPAAAATGQWGEPIAVLVHNKKTDAGRYKAWATGTYALTNDTVWYRIVPDTADAQWSNLSFVYDNTPHKPTAEAMLGLTTQSLNVTGEQTNAGAGFRVTASIPAPYASNYVLRDDDTLFVIEPAPVDVRWQNETVTYNGASQMPTAEMTHPQALIPVQLTVVIDGSTATDSGRYTAKAYYTSGNLGANYRLNDDSITFIITPYNSRVDWSNSVLTYNGSNQTPGAVAYGPNNAAVSLIITDSARNADTDYTASASTADHNYTLDNADTIYTILPAPVQVVWGDTLLAYNGQLQAPYAQATGVLSEPLVLTISNRQRDVGSYRISAATANANYQLLNADTSFTIAPVPAPVLWDSTSFIYNTRPHTPTAVAIAGLNDTIPITIYGAQTDAGRYKAWATAASQNAILVNDTVFYTIEQARKRFVWGSRTFQYDGNVHTPTAIVARDDGGSDTLEVQGGQTNASIDPYAAVVRTPANYQLQNALDTVFEIRPTSANVEWTGTNPTYNGLPQKPGASIKTLDRGADSTLFLDVTFPEVPGAAPVNAGIYRVQANRCNYNYQIDGNLRQFTIRRRPLYILFSPIKRISIANSQSYVLSAYVLGGLNPESDEGRQDMNRPVVHFRVKGSNAAATIRPDQDTILRLRDIGDVTVEAYIDTNYYNNFSVRYVERTITIVRGGVGIAKIEVTNATPDPVQAGLYRITNCWVTETWVKIIPDGSGTRVFYNGQELINNDSIRVDVSKGGRYSVPYALQSEDGVEYLDTVYIEKQYAFDDLVAVKYNNVLYVKPNDDYNITGYEWYRNGELVSTKQYWSAGNNATDTIVPEDEFRLSLTTDRGETITSCVGSLAPQSNRVGLRAAAAMVVYPNPVPKGRSVTLQTRADVGTEIKIYDVAGALVGTKNVAGTYTEVQMPTTAGVYFIIVGSESVRVAVE